MTRPTVRVIHVGRELHRRRVLRVVLRKLEHGIEEAALERRAGRPDDDDGPLENVVVHQPRRKAINRVLGEVCRISGRSGGQSAGRKAHEGRRDRSRRASTRQRSRASIAGRAGARAAAHGGRPTARRPQHSAVDVPFSCLPRSRAACESAIESERERSGRWPARRDEKMRPIPFASAPSHIHVGQRKRIHAHVLGRRQPVAPGLAQYVALPRSIHGCGPFFCPIRRRHANRHAPRPRAAPLDDRALTTACLVPRRARLSRCSVDALDAPAAGQRVPRDAEPA